MYLNKNVLGMGLMILALTWQIPSWADETENAAKSMGARMSSEIAFDEGKSTLTDSAKEEIRKSIGSAKEHGKINEVKVAVWADREYPSQETKASKADVKLAEERAKSLKEFLKKEMSVKNVSTFNMTERPNSLQKFLRTPTARTKETMETAGAAPSKTSETGMFNQRAQSSKAVLMFYTE